MADRIVLGIDCWYPQVDGVTTAVVSYRRELQGESLIVAPSYGKKTDAAGEEAYCRGVFHNRSLAVPFLGFRNSTPGSDKKLKRRLREFAPEILHAHSPFAICAYFAKYGKKHGIPLVYTFHTKYKDEFLRFTHSRLLTAILMRIIMRNIRKADAVWAVSESAAQTLRSYGYRGEIAIMRNGTDMLVADEAELAAARSAEGAYRKAEGERVFLYVGRVVSVKNLAFSFQVLAALQKRGFCFKFFVVGGGEDLEAHKKLAARLGIAQNVVFTGFEGDRARLRQYYACADLVLFPSLFDTFGLVLLEAAACRTPALVPAGSGVAEVVTDGVTGFAEELSAEAWADRIEAMFSDGSYERVCAQCPQIVRSWESAVAEAAAEYDRILARHRQKQTQPKKK